MYLSDGPGQGGQQCLLATNLKIANLPDAGCHASRASLFHKGIFRLAIGPAVYLVGPGEEGFLFPKDNLGGQQPVAPSIR